MLFTQSSYIVSKTSFIPAKYEKNLPSMVSITVFTNGNMAGLGNPPDKGIISFGALAVEKEIHSKYLW